MTAAERLELKRRLAELRRDLEDRRIMLDVLARIASGDYPFKKARVRRGTR